MINTLYEYMNLLAVIKKVHSEHADDLCWMDIDLIFKAAGLPVPDRKVGCKLAMKKNCDRYIDTMCSEGTWKSYAELEAELANAKEVIEQLRSVNNYLEESIGALESRRPWL